jgi:hypothetical protein
VWAAHRPWLAVVAALALVGYIAARNVVASWRHRFHATDARLVAIAPPPEVDPAAAAALWANLAGILTPARRRRILHGVLHVVFQYAWTGRQRPAGRGGGRGARRLARGGHHHRGGDRPDPRHSRRPDRRAPATPVRGVAAASHRPRRRLAARVDGRRVAAARR